MGQNCKMIFNLCVRHQGGSWLPQILQHVAEGLLHKPPLLLSDIVHFGLDCFVLDDLAAKVCKLLGGEAHRHGL